MYQQFFGFRELPFELTPNPRYLFLTATASRGAEHAGLRPVVGERASRRSLAKPGTGKTTLLHAALQSERCRNVRAST